jgi:hypothetical protein
MREAATMATFVRRDPDALFRTLWALSICAHVAFLVVLFVTPPDTDTPTGEAWLPRSFVDLSWPRRAAQIRRFALASIAPPVLARQPETPPEPPPVPFEERLLSAAELDGFTLADTPPTGGCFGPEVTAELSPPVRRCYVTRLAHGVPLSGTLVTRVTIDERGFVTEAAVDSDEIEDPELAACILNVLRERRLPACGDGPSEIRQPWTFSPRP